jgi:hypothetical protein
MNDEEIVVQTIDLLQGWVGKKGHDACWYYPEIFRQLCDLYGVDHTKVPELPSRPDFIKGCHRYQLEVIPSTSKLVGMTGDVFHGVEEFCYLPWDELVPERYTFDWSSGRGGHGLRDDQMTIMTFRKGDDAEYLSQDIWVVPPAFQIMIDRHIAWAERDLKRSICTLIGAASLPPEENREQKDQ